MRFVIRLFGFVQWLAAVVIAALFVTVQVQTLEEIDGGGPAEALVELSGGIDAVGGPAVAEMLGALVGSVRLALDSMSVTTPALLLSILLMLSALYCQRAAHAIGRGKLAGTDSQPPGTHPAETRDVEKEKANDVQA